MRVSFTREDGTTLEMIEEVRMTNKWIIGDFELLGTEWERDRAEISGQPQTVIMECRDSGIFPASDDYIRLTLALNPWMMYSDLVGMMDKFTPHGAKWREGDTKVPGKIVFGCNPINTFGPHPNTGGLTGIPLGYPLYLIDTLPYESLFMYKKVEDIPAQYVMHFTNNVNGANVVNPPPYPGRVGPPVRLLITSRSQMYLRPEYLDDIKERNNIYSPAWRPQGNF